MEKFGGEIRGGVGKVACWSTKVAISLKRIKIEEQLLWRAYREYQNFQGTHRATIFAIA